MKTIAKIMTIFGFLALFGTAWANEPIIPGAISHWKFDEGSGSTAYDSAGSNDGTLVNSPVWTSGKINDALSFDGVDDFVATANNIFTNAQLASGATLSAWFKTDSTAYSYIADDEGYLALGINHFAHPNKLLGTADGGKHIYYSSSDVNDNLWHHAAIAWNGTNTAILYLDGVGVSSGASGPPTPDSKDKPFTIGVHSSISAYFDGTIDDVRIYNRALSAEEIQQLYQNGFGDVVGLEIIGPEEVVDNSSAQYTAIASFEDGFTANVTSLALWSVEPNDYASIDANGLLTTECIEMPEGIIIYAQYTKGQLTVEDEMTVHIALPVELKIIGPEFVREDYQTQYTAVVYYDNGQASNVTALALWQVEPQTVASIDANGLLWAEEINEPQDITIYALYTCRGVAVGSEMAIRVLPSPYIWRVPIDFETIQAAIDYSIDGEQVVVADGTYTGLGNRDIDFLGKAITVRSQSGPENCIIDCNGTETNPHRAFHFHNDEDPKTFLDGFTIINGFHMYGGGICCKDSSSPTINNCIIADAIDSSGIYCNNSSPMITNCTIRENGGYHGGGGIYCEDSSPTINNCIITNNAGHRGGGIYCQNSSPVITDCNITGNWGGGPPGGGGIHCRDSSPIIKNCTITNNSAGNGGGIKCYSSNPTITNCTISKNSSLGAGGGIYLAYSPPITRKIMTDKTEEYSLIISNCRISGNTAGAGGGIYCEYSNPMITNCTIKENVVFSYGGGICCDHHSSPIITNCSITNNSATDRAGGGIYCSDSRPVITNCTISGNRTRAAGGGIWGCLGPITNCTITGNKVKSEILGGGGLSYCRGDITNCIIWDNFAFNYPQLRPFGHIEYNCIQNWTSGDQDDVSPARKLEWGEGNIDTDPCFVLPGYWVDINDPNTIVEPNDPNAVWVEGDYHLLPASPCIDTGDPDYIPEPNETDLDGNPRISGTRIDMGAYETNYIEAEMNFTPKTINCNSRGNLVKAHITLPDEFLPEDVDVNEPAWAETIDLESEYIKLLGSNPVRLEIAFDRQAFCAPITEPGQLEVTIIGSFTNNQNFYATDTIKIIPHR